MIYVDDHEPAAIDALLMGYGATVERTLLNKPTVPPRPDYGFYCADGGYLGISRKQAGEFIGGIDACETQLLAEMNCDYMALVIEGCWTASPSGQCYTWDWDSKAYMGSIRQGMTYGNTRMVRREYSQSYKGVRQKLARFQDLGIYVMETHDLADTALAIVALHNELTKPTASLTTFKRLIPERYTLTEEDMAKRTLALQLMGCVPGIGEEIALAIADAGWVESISRLCYLFENAPEGWDAIAKLPLRSGKRTIGPAAVARMRKALGC